MDFALEVLIVAIGSVGRHGRRLAGRGTNGTLGMDRRDLDLSRLGLRALSSRCRLRRPELYGHFSSPASRPCGRFVLAFILFGAPRGEATTRAIASCASNGATERAGDFFGFFRCRRRRVSFSRFRSRRRPIGRRSGWTSATRWASPSSRSRPLAKARRIGNWPASARDPKNQVQDLRRRALGLFSPSELFFRVARLGRLRDYRHRTKRRLSMGLASASRPPSSCTCCLSMCRGSRRWKPICFGRGATRSASTRRA